jgi:hypothetical protein
VPRDLRDPRIIGSLWEGMRAAHADKSACWFYDNVIAAFNIPNYPQDELLSTVTQREYREELQQAAKEGDKYAAERLTELG